MKRIIAFVMAAMMLMTCAFACAEGNTLYPVHKLDMETYGLEDSTVNAEFNAANIDGNLLIYNVYALDLYPETDIKALQPGDAIFAYGEEIPVKKVEAVDGGYDINSGFFEEDNGASLMFDADDPTMLVAYGYDGFCSYTMLGQAANEFADEVTIKTYKMAEDGDYNGEYNEVTLPAAEVKAYLEKITADGEEGYPEVSIFCDSCTVTMKDGKVSQITVEWTPAS